MAFKKGSSPTHNILLSVKVGDAYKQCPVTIGQWSSDKGPITRGSLKGENLQKVVKFLTVASSKSLPVNVSVFKAKPKKKTEDSGDDFDTGDSGSGDEFDL